MTNLKRMIIGALGFWAITLLPAIATAQDLDDLKNLSGIRCGCETEAVSDAPIQRGNSMVTMASSTITKTISISPCVRGGRRPRCSVRV